eukprot:2618053-Rhodomonas_salina.1
MLLHDVGHHYVGRNGEEVLEPDLAVEPQVPYLLFKCCIQHAMSGAKVCHSAPRLHQNPTPEHQNPRSTAHRTGHRAGLPRIVVQRAC